MGEDLAAALPTLLAARPIAGGADCFRVFVDGGLSPYNDPSLARLTLARMRRFGLSWPTEPRRVFVLSIGAGDFEIRIPAAAAGRLGALLVAFLVLCRMVQDSEAATRLLIEWMGQSTHPAGSTARSADSTRRSWPRNLFSITCGWTCRSTPGG